MSLSVRPGEILGAAAGGTVLLAGIPVFIVLTHTAYPVEFMTSPKAALVIGALSSGTGLGLFFWSCYELIIKGKGGPAVLGKLKLTRETRFLVTTGPYSICRNPMHLGLILYYFGLSCAINSLSGLLTAVAFAVFAWLAAVYADEPRLKRDFGREYDKWASVVPRFIPRTRKSPGGNQRPPQS